MLIETSKHMEKVFSLPLWHTSLLSIIQRQGAIIPEFPTNALLFDEFALTLTDFYKPTEQFRLQFMGAAHHYICYHVFSDHHTCYFATR